MIAILLAGAFGLQAQNVPGSGWNSLGVLPFGGYDFVFLKAPSRYVAYFVSHPQNTVGEGIADPIARAFSSDLNTWTADPNDLCSTSGDLCTVAGSRPHPSGALTLPDGTVRLFILASTGGLASLISSDGIGWTQEPGIRMLPSSGSIFEHGNFALNLLSFVTLPDGRVRMYYVGGVTPGSTGTPSYYNNCFGCGVILSAISNDNGLTWVREPGVRVNPLVQGPVGPGNSFQGVNVSAVAVIENGRTVYRIYAPGQDGSTASYISDDGLSFGWEGQ